VLPLAEAIAVTPHSSVLASDEEGSLAPRMNVDYQYGVLERASSIASMASEV
jgi:hypothetical protein